MKLCMQEDGQISFLPSWPHHSARSEDQRTTGLQPHPCGSSTHSQMSSETSVHQYFNL